MTVCMAFLPMAVLANGSKPPPETMKPKVLYASLNCPIKGTDTSATGQWITTQAQLDQVYAQLRSLQLGEEKPGAPKLDFYSTGVLMLHMGNKNTGGYRLQLPRQDLVVKDGGAVLRVQWSEPAPGAIVTQVMTSPCLLVRMPLDDYHRIEVVDQNNHTRIKLSL